MSILGINTVPQRVYQSTLKNSKTTAKSNTNFKKNNTPVNMKTESAVDEYKRKHPNDTYNVDRQVNAGKAVLSKNGADKISRDDMTMEEYKNFITGLMNSIPFDASQRNSTEIWSISEKGWEQMKNDPDYEAWVLGYTSQNRGVHFPALIAGANHIYTESFGASIEEHIGQSVSQGGFGSSTSKKYDNEESWWEKRHKLYVKMLKVQAEKAMKKAQAKQISAQRQYYEQVIDKNKGLIQTFGGENQILQALMAYESNFYTGSQKI